MVGKKILSQKAVPLVEVQKIVETRKKEGELSYEQNLTLEYCKKFAKLNQKDTAAAIKELIDLEKVTETHAVSLTDLMPNNEGEVKLIFAKEHFILAEDEISKILEVLGKYRK
ncbi:MAG: RNA polymerase Rpb4 family protein [archaeon]